MKIPERWRQELKRLSGFHSIGPSARTRAPRPGIRVLDTAEVDDDLLVMELAERSFARLTQASAEIPSRQPKQQ